MTDTIELTIKGSPEAIARLLGRPILNFPIGNALTRQEPALSARESLCEGLSSFLSKADWKWHGERFTEGHQPTHDIENPVPPTGGASAMRPGEK